ncbi:MAG: Vms1/Ankzf1 family peptidyl-tRNA hydrolase [Candidatus Nanohaloarchaea archaeon]
MKLPWRRKIEEKEERIEELEQRVEELEQELDSCRERFEAEKERRSELARKKQEAEEELNRLEDRLETRGHEEETLEEEEKQLESLEFREALRLLQKLATVESPEEDLLTVYSPERVDEVEDFRGLKNAVTPGQLEELEQTESFAAFIDPDRETVVLKTRPFFTDGWTLEDGFDVSPLLEFIEAEKVFALVSAGETSIYRESEGEYEELDRVSSRVDRKHSKGGFSQDRFERKREEQVEQHLDEVEDALEDRENVYLLGDRSLCKELPGEYLGGFDPNLGKPEVFYSFQQVS